MLTKAVSYKIAPWHDSLIFFVKQRETCLSLPERSEYSIIISKQRKHHQNGYYDGNKILFSWRDHESLSTVPVGTSLGARQNLS